MNAIRLLILALLASSTTSCSRGDKEVAGRSLVSTTATLVREVRAQEPDPPLGAYTSFIAVASNGSFFITDIDRGRIVAFDPAGSVTRSFGSLGGGPGEFSLAATPEVIGDTLLAVADVNANSLMLFDVRNGQYMRTVKLAGFRNLAGDWSYAGDTAYFATLDAGGVLGVWPMVNDTARLRGELPAEYRSGRPRGLVRRYGRIGIAPTSEGFAVHLPTEDGVRRLSLGGEVGPLIGIPARHRRGIPPELVQLKANTSRSRTTNFPLASFNTGLARRGDGLLVAYHWEFDHDPKSKGSESGGGPGMTNLRLFATLIKPALDSACIDIRIPIETDIPPFPVTRGDTTFVFTRSVNVAQGTVNSRLVAFRADPRSCQWEPIGGAPPRQQ